MEKTPLEKSKEDFLPILDKIKAASSVGIDAPYTHAIIIDYLRQIDQRIKRIEEIIDKKHLR